MAEVQPIQNIDEFRQSLKLIRFVLKSIGLSAIYGPKTTNAVSWLRENYFYVISFCQLFTTCVGEITFTFQAFGGSLEEVTAMTPCFCFCILALTKMHGLFIRRYIIRDLLNQLDALWPRTNLSDDDKAVKNVFLKRLSFSTQLLAYMFISLIKVFNLTPIFGMVLDYIKTGTCERGLPYIVWYPFDPFSPTIYPIVYMYQYWSGLVCVLGIVGPDCVFQLSCSHTCMLVKLLQEEIRNVVPELKEGERDLQINDEIYTNKLKALVIKHQILISLCNELELIYNIDIFVNVTFASLILCFIGFQIIINDARELAKYFMFLSSCLIHTLILSYYGNKLIDTTAGVADAAYDCRWYLTGPRFKVILKTLMTRAQKPLSVTALRFSDLSLITFTGILGTSWSYFNLLRTIYDSDR